MNKKIVVLGFGGTIAGRSSLMGDNISYRAGEVNVADLLSGIPSLSKVLGTTELIVEQVAQIDSKDLEDAHWLGLAQRVDYFLALPDVLAVVITHGTDTLEETAYFLQYVLSQDALFAKPVVLTCAMRPATALTPDGPQNICDAIAVALQPGAKNVLVVCAGAIHSADHIQKIHPYRLDAFDSGDAGPLGYVQEGTVRLVNAWPTTSDMIERSGQRNVLSSHTLHELPWPRVEIVLSHAGAGADMINAMLYRGQFTDRPLRGIVVAGTGNGTIHRYLEEALQRALAQGVAVVRSTRCAYGAVVLSNSPQMGAIVASSLSPVKARIRMVLDLLDREANSD